MKPDPIKPEKYVNDKRLSELALNYVALEVSALRFAREQEQKKVLALLGGIRFYLTDAIAQCKYYDLKEEGGVLFLVSLAEGTANRRLISHMPAFTSFEQIDGFLREELAVVADCFEDAGLTFPEQQEEIAHSLHTVHQLTRLLIDEVAGKFNIVNKLDINSSYTHCSNHGVTFFSADPNAKIVLPAGVPQDLPLEPQQLDQGDVRSIPESANPSGATNPEGQGRAPQS